MRNNLEIALRLKEPFPIKMSSNFRIPNKIVALIVTCTSYYTNSVLMHIALNNKYYTTLLNIKLFT